MPAKDVSLQAGPDGIVRSLREQLISLQFSNEINASVTASILKRQLLIAANASETSQSITPFIALNAGSIQFAQATSTHSEIDGTVQITLTRTNGSDGAISATVTDTGGTAVAGTDYAAVNETVNWVDGDTADKTVPVSIVDRSGVEQGDQTLELTVANPTGGATIGAQATHTVTITRSPPPIRF